MSYEYAPGFGADAAPAATPTIEQQLSGVIAQKVTGKTSGKAYDTAVQAAQFGFSQLYAAGEYLGKTQVGRTIKSTATAAAAAYTLVEKCKAGKFKPDAAGVVAVTAGIDAVMGTVADIASSIPGGGEVAKQIREWSAVAGVCAIGTVAALGTGVGAVAGPIACGFAVLGKVLAEVLGGAPPEYNPNSLVRSTFNMQSENKPLIAADALRLVKVLRHHYGVNGQGDASYYGMYRSLLGLNRFDWMTVGYPSLPPMDKNGTVIGDANKAIPAHNLATILHMLCAQQLGLEGDAANINVRDGYALLSCLRTGCDPSGKALYVKYNEDHDINESAIGTAALLGRSAVGTYNSPIVRAQIGGGGNLQSWPGSSGTYNINLLPFIQVDELINFFAAVTAVEFQQFGPEALSKYGFGANNPVRFVYVRDMDRLGKQEGAGGYSATCFTNLERSTDLSAAVINKNNCAYALSLARDGDFRALREFGAMRLMSAFSYLQLMWYWSSRYADAPSKKDPFVFSRWPDLLEEEKRWGALAKPVDPRQVVRNGKIAFGAPAWSLRADDGVVADAPSSTVPNIANAAGASTDQKVFLTSNGARVLPYSGSVLNVCGRATSFCANSVPGSNINHVRIGDAVAERNAIVEKAMRAAISYQDQLTMEAVSSPGVLAMLQTIAKQNTYQMMTKTAIVPTKQASSSDGAGVLIGAAALAALLLMR